MKCLTDYGNVVQQKIPCEFSGCNQIFPGPLLLRRHIQVKHRDHKRKATETTESVSLKKRFDAISRPFVTDFCKENGKNPAKIPTLALHEKIDNFKSSAISSADSAFNTTFKRYPDKGSLQCKYCDYKAKSAGGLNRHRTGHTGGRKCSKCNRGYSDNSSSSDNYLRQHEKSCDGGQKWLAVSEDNLYNPNLSKDESRNKTIPLMKMEPSVESPIQIQFKTKEVKSPTETVLKEEREKLPSRNIKFQAFVSSQGLNVKTEAERTPERTPTVPLYSYNAAHQPENSSEAPQSEKLPTPKKTAQERTQFGTKGKNSPAIFTDYKEMIIVGKKYEKYWCMGCKNWLLGGKVNSGHGKVSRSMEIV